MEYITYKQAADLLNKPNDSIRQAVSRGSLTKYKLPGKQALLLKPQVELFKGEKWITPKMLRGAKRQQWDEYRRIAELHLTPVQIQTEEKLKTLQETIETQFTSTMNKVSEVIQEIFKASYIEEHRRYL